jgi:hypothetical protein
MKMDQRNRGTKIGGLHKSALLANKLLESMYSAIKEICATKPRRGGHAPKRSLPTFTPKRMRKLPRRRRI